MIKIDLEPKYHVITKETQDIYHVDLYSVPYEYFHAVCKDIMARPRWSVKPDRQFLEIVSRIANSSIDENGSLRIGTRSELIIVMQGLGQIARDDLEQRDCGVTDQVMQRYKNYEHGVSEVLEV